jgi:hypothetical protein
MAPPAYGEVSNRQQTGCEASTCSALVTAVRKGADLTNCRRNADELPVCS